ncbi:MAG: hypothetical protein HQL87_04175 [Magnetococcales bacterium]|nr:hypothetical protein [Magnetococcales bacterium]
MAVFAILVFSWFFIAIPSCDVLSIMTEIVFVVAAVLIGGLGWCGMRLIIGPMNSLEE